MIGKAILSSILTSFGGGSEDYDDVEPSTSSGEGQQGQQGQERQQDGAAAAAAAAAAAVVPAPTRALESTLASGDYDGDLTGRRRSAAEQSTDYDDEDELDGSTLVPVAWDSMSSRSVEAVEGDAASGAAAAAAATQKL